MSHKIILKIYFFKEKCYNEGIKKTQIFKNEHITKTKQETYSVIKSKIFRKTSYEY